LTKNTGKKSKTTKFVMDLQYRQIRMISEGSCDTGVRAAEKSDSPSQE